MKKSRFTSEQSIGFIEQADAGMAVSEPARAERLQPRQLLRLAGQARGMEAGDAKRLKRLLAAAVASCRHGSSPTTAHKPATMQPLATLGFIGNHWYGQWRQVIGSLE